MVAYVEAHADRVTRKIDRVECSAFYRGGDNPASLVVFLETGAWADARAGVSGGAREFSTVVAGMPLPDFMKAYGRVDDEPRRPRRPPVRTAPDAERFLREMRSFWDGLVPVDAVAAAVAWLKRRGFDPGRVVDTEVVRGVPAGARVPSWAHQKRRSWGEAFSIVTAMFDANGVHRGLHARRTVEDETLSKTTSPVGQPTKGLVFSNRLGRLMLTGASGAAQNVVAVSRAGRDGVVITEGLPSWLAHCCDASDADEDAPAVIGILAGAWSAEHAQKIPDRARVLVDVDGDKAGDAYAAQIIGSLEGRNIDLNRIKRHS